jgi:hypothetical protein
MTKNKISNLNDHLFLALERLNDVDLDSEQIAIEIERSRAISGLAQQVVSSADVILKAAKFMDDHDNLNINLPAMLSGDIKK